MRRFFAPPELMTGERIELPADILQHIKVLRLAVGAQIELLDGEGQLLLCRLEQLQKSAGLARVEKRLQLPEQQLQLQLLQGIPKGSKLELVLQKGTELGITRFTPVYCHNGDVRPSGRQAGKQERWSRIVREAARQSQQGRLPRVDEPQDLVAALNSCSAGLRLFPWERAARPLQKALPALPPASVALLIGPEGGFTEREAEQAAHAGFEPVSLGGRILRSETAGIAVASIIQYLFGDLGADPAGSRHEFSVDEEGL